MCIRDSIKVVQMFNDMKERLKDWEDEEELKAYLLALLRKEAFDKSGLIYGMGHAVYSLSDPRANVFKRFVRSLSEEKGRMDEFQLYSKVERLAAEIIAKERKIYKGVSANIDFYSGFVYSMLDLPQELYTPDVYKRQQFPFLKGFGTEFPDRWKHCGEHRGGSTGGSRGSGD